jgi:c-di-GMP-binding flagellar brake protein YcgR
VHYEEIITLGELFEIQCGNTVVRTKAQEILSATEFTVLQPTVKGMPLRTEGKDVSFMFYRPNGCYRFTACISHPYWAGDIMLCRVERLSEIKRVQRRRYFRLPIVLDILLYELDAVGLPDGRPFRGKTIDISEKSAAISCFTAFSKDTLLEVRIRLSNVDTIQLRAKVLRTIKPLQTTDPYKIVLIFFDYCDKDRHFLRRYILKQQIQLRKKMSENTE